MNMQNTIWFLTIWRAPVTAAFLFVLALVPFSGFAAGLNFTNAVTMELTSATFATYTIAAGSEADALTVGTTTFTVTVATGDTFTVTASANIALSNTASVSTTCGSSTSSLVLTGPVTNVVVTPANTACVSASSSSVDLAPPPAPSSIAATADATGITLTWVDPIASDFSRIVIYRNGGGVLPVSGDIFGAAAVGVKTYRDTAVTAGVQYRYIVVAEDAAGNRSTNTDEVTALVPAAAVASAPSSSGGTTSTGSPAPAASSAGSVTPSPSSSTSGHAVSEVLPEKELDPRAVQLKKILTEARRIATKDVDEIATAAHKTRDVALETTRNVIVVKVVGAGASDITKEKVNAFVTYGTETTDKLGAGERGGMVDSFRAAFGKDPVTVQDWEDVVKLANGRFPGQTNAVREASVSAAFASVYKRTPNRVNPNDNAAVIIMAYGLRQADGFRDLGKERIGILTFRNINGRAPLSASDWDIARAIAYSGAKR